MRILTFGMVMAALVLLLISACSDGGSRPTAPVFKTVSGAVVQGPVKDALVIADKNGNRKLDAGEPSNEVSTYTDENGDFDDLVIPEGYGDYTLVSKGGTDTLSGRPGLTLLAPAGAKNITPATTLVELAPEDKKEELKASLATLSGSGSYDADPSEEAAAAFVSLVKVVEETLYLVEDLGATDDAEAEMVTTEISKTLVEENAIANLLDDDTENDTIAPAVTKAIKAVLPELKTSSDIEIETAEEDDAVVAAFEAVVTKVEENVADAAETSTTGTVNETDVAKLDDAEKEIIVNEAVAIALEDETATFDNITRYAVLTVTDIAFYDMARVKTNVADEIDEIVVSFDAFNSTLKDKVYDNAVLNLELNQNGSDRSVSFSVDKVEVTLSGPSENFHAPAFDLSFLNSMMTVAAVKADGTRISSELKAYDVLFSNDASTYELTFDFAQIRTLLAEKVASEFGTTSLTGQYALTLRADGVPLEDYAQTVTFVE
ncbi:MAG: hypothetical protein C0618_11870 [Desulfuromonas sp.]|nr:MAG: hypothetical protein C0618_11870 [Desulfuromonas sp.]